MDEDVKEILITEDEIKARIKELGILISEDYKEKFPLLICILRGAFLFLADLVKETKIPLSIDFMAISTYAGKTESSGEVKILKDLDTSIEGRHVLIIEDIVDTGLTMDSVTRLLKTRKPKSLKICTLLDKVERRRTRRNRPCRRWCGRRDRTAGRTPEDRPPLRARGWRARRRGRSRRDRATGRSRIADCSPQLAGRGTE